MKSIRLPLTPVLLLLLSLAALPTFAKVRGAKVTFPTETMVNNSTVKRGAYRVAFDEATGELTISKNHTIIARAPARLENNHRRPEDTQIISSEEGGRRILHSITLPGDGQTIVLEAAEKSAKSAATRP